MQENVGGVDRTWRWMLGPTLMTWGLAQLARRRRGLWAGASALVLGTGVLESAITRVCPMNYVLGIDTSRLGREPLRVRAPVRPRVGA